MTMKPRSSPVADFCRRHNFSESTFYRRRSDMPRTIKVGGQLRILDRDEAVWIEQKQAAADASGSPDGHRYDRHKGNPG